MLCTGGNQTLTPYPPTTGVGILSAQPTGYVVQEVSSVTGVALVNVTNPGSGYTNPTVAFLCGGGVNAAATAFMGIGPTLGQIIGIEVTQFGQNYTSPPEVVILDPTGTGATATAVLQEGQPFIGGDFMAALSGRLVLGNIIGGGVFVAGAYYVSTYGFPGGKAPAPSVPAPGYD